LSAGGRSEQGCRQGNQRGRTGLHSNFLIGKRVTTSLAVASSVSGSPHIYCRRLPQ
jgi:hypothetical protein